jgi:hypothetical protein
MKHFKLELRSLLVSVTERIGFWSLAAVHDLVPPQVLVPKDGPSDSLSITENRISIGGSAEAPASKM